MGRARFEGWYFKHQARGRTIAFIPGQAASGAFVQVITDERAWHFEAPSLQVDRSIRAGSCVFSEDGLSVDLPGITGRVAYGPPSPLKSDIMGPFRFLPMECRHGVISMRHSLRGTLFVEGQPFPLDGGLGYIEKDSGRSFPRQYLWLQCNDFPDSLSVMVSVASIPLAGLRFTGCIAAILHEGREYRLATYRSVRIEVAEARRVWLSQGPLRLEIDLLESQAGHALKSPIFGRMTGMIRESHHACARFRFWVDGRMLFDQISSGVSFECCL